MNKSEISIIWKPKLARVSQIFGRGMEYALVSKEYQQIHQFVYCRDFLQDTIHAFLNKKDLDIYNFRYYPTKSLPVYLDSTRLLIASYRDGQFKKKIDPILDFLHQIEDEMKMKRTEAFYCKQPMPTYKRSGVFMLEASKRWMKAPPLISLYTFLIRIGCSHTVGQSYKNTMDRIQSGEITPYQKFSWGENKYPDLEYLEKSRQAIDLIINAGDRKLFSGHILSHYPSQWDFSVVHNRFGLVGYAQKEAKPYMPHWYRKMEKCKVETKIGA